MPHDASEIAFNPLEPLRDDAQVHSVYRRILTQRVNTEILSGHFGLGARCDTFHLPYGATTRDEFVDRLIGFLCENAARHPAEVAADFWSEFSFRGPNHFVAVPSDIRPILKKYFHAKERKTDLLLIDDLLVAPLLGDGTLADIGCGRNKLGRVILADLDRRGVDVKAIIGTDVSAYGERPADPRLSFVRQPEPTSIPLEPDSVDLAITKWALHHMDGETQRSLVRQIAELVKAGGHVVVVEALRGNGQGLWDSFIEETRNARTWPPGEWFEGRWRLTQDHFALGLDQQRAVLAMEDYFGHWLEQRHTWMPLPFTYMTPTMLCDLFLDAGFHEERSLWRVFGMAPIIHWGPPTIRLVFKNVKGAPSGAARSGSGGGYLA